MLDKLEAIRERFIEVSEAILDPNIMSDMKRYTSLNKEYKELNKINDVYVQYKNILDNIDSSKKVLSVEKDPDFREMAKEELETLATQKDELEIVIKELLIPKDPNDSKNIILEIRGGSGGDEASIFAGDIFRMYQRYCERMNWKMELIDATEGTSGGYKEIICSVAGDDVFGKLKFESGVHRVQRVPATETQGRIHTSAASVAVLPEVEEVDIQLNMNDIRKDTFCSSGPGGQSVNTTYSAIRLTHIPSGTVVQCQDEKSQMKNFDKALKVLRSRIYEIEYKKQQDELGKARNSMIGSGDRTVKIITYNYPQSRVTDHRIGYTVHNLTQVMDGNIGDFIEELRLAENANRLQEGVA